MTFSPDYLCHPGCVAQDALAEQLEARKADMDEIERLRSLLRQCLVVADSEELKGLAVLAHVHGMPYSGPVIPSEGIREALGSGCDPPGESNV